MANQWKHGKLEHRNGFIEKEGKKLKYIEKIVTMALNNNKANCVADILGDMDLTIVRDLSLCSKQLTHLSEELGLRLKNLVRLDLSNNKLESLPFSLQRLAHLRLLLLNHNSLRTLPLMVTNITRLRVLQLSNNSIETLPKNLGDLKSLESLNLSSNFLKELPDSCENLNQLKNLNLANNAFNRLPNCITRGMRVLETLDISSNLYINVAMTPASKKLKNLYIRTCGTGVKFPTWVLRGRAPVLQVFNCDGTRFKSFVFPENCQSLKLQILSMESCSLFDNFMQNITSLTDELETLKIGNEDGTRHSNAFWKIPILNLKRPRLLTEISIRGTGLPDVCHEIGNFVNLVKLDLGDNSISWLPDEICQLNKLNVLLVNENQLSSLPEDIGRMTSLKELKADRNNIANLPESIKDLKNLAYLDLYDNEFRGIPEHLEHIESLLGVDLDFNQFEINDLRIRDFQYETLRNTLRKRYQTDGYQRSTGPRVNINENDANLQENWDESDNSADEMEFNCEITVSSKRETISFASTLPNRFAFCPADLHNLPVRQQVALKRQRGEIKDDFELVEGQFDDI